MCYENYGKETDQRVKVRKIPYYRSDSKEASMIWYQESDYRRMDEENDIILQIMMMDEHEDDSSIATDCSRSIFCTRGLEGLRPDRALDLQRRRKALWDAVIDEQLRQWSAGIDDPKAIGKVYRKQMSLHPFERIALLRGLIDEKRT